MPDIPSPEPEITFRPASGGRTQVEVIVGDRTVSWLSIEPFTLRIGAATVRMDGIAGVGTEEEFRRRGYARRLLEATVAWMRQGDAALSMLYGIRDFYPKFGYATAGPDHRVVIQPGGARGAGRRGLPGRCGCDGAGSSLRVARPVALVRGVHGA